MEHLASLLFRVAGSVYLPQNLRALSGSLLLHISDTPSSLYGVLGRLCRVLRPAWIVLTGDLADEIKLEFNPALLPRYTKKLEGLRAALGPALEEGGRLVITLGNHDDAATLARLFPTALLFDTVGRFQAGDLDCAASHWARSAYDSGAEYLFFGHDRKERTRLEGGRVFLNGIEDINLIELGSRELFFLPYPAGTDNERLLRHKIGM